MTRWTRWAGLVIVIACAVSAPAMAGEHLLGGGIHYWRTIDDLAADDFDIEEDGQAYVLSYQYRPAGLFSFEIDAEYFEKGFGGSTDAAFSPQAYIVFGHGWYAALGGGVIYSSSFEDEVSDPFYAAKIGWDLVLVPRVHIDVNANYRFDTFSELDQASTDTITLGALLRFRL